MDEKEIISLQKQVMQEQFSSIYSPLTYINKKRYHFVEQEIPIANMLIRLPREFIDLPPNIARLKYPSEDRPQCIKSSSDIYINFGFKVLPAKAREEDLIAARDAVLDALKKVHPQNTYLETGINKFGANEERIFCWFDFCAPTLDTDVYSFYAFMEQNDKPLFFLFNCPKNDYKNWRPIVFEVIKSIRDKPIGWEGDAKK